MGLKGLALFSFVIGLVVLFIGIALMYLLPDYIVGALNQTGLFNVGDCQTFNTSPAQCGTAASNCCEYKTIYNARTNVGQLRALGFVICIIAMIWMVISVVAGGTGKR